MLKRSLTIAAATLALTSAFASPTLAAPADFIGTWVNKDANTRGITRLVITSAGGNKLNIRVFGQCHPTDCDWGTTTLTTYGVNVQDSNHGYGSADYNKGFANTFLGLSNTSNQIMVQSYTQFLDNSGRQNYYSRDYFQKAPLIKVPIKSLPILPHQ